MNVELYIKCNELLQKYPKIFRKKIIIKKNVKIEIFNIKKSQSSSNYKILIEEDALDMRGLFFIFKEGKLIDVSFTHKKFFNVDENEYSTTDYINNEFELIAEEDKSDGSSITLFYVGDEYFLRTNSDIESEYTNIAKAIIDENQDYHKFILDLKNKNLKPIFELCFERGELLKNIVDYKFTKLILTKIRDNEGGYVDINQYRTKYPNIRFAELHQLPSNLIDRLKEIENSNDNIEGVVLTFKDKNGKIVFLKKKTKAYIEKHYKKYLIERLNSSYHVLLKNILDGTFDDIKSNAVFIFNEDENVQEKLIHFEKNVVTLIDNMIENIYGIIENIKTFNINKTEYVAMFDNTELKHIVLKLWNKKDDYPMIKSEEDVEIQVKNFLSKKYSSNRKCLELL